MPGARLRHDHEVFELEEVLKFGSLSLAKRVRTGQIQKMGDAGAGVFGRAECIDLLSSFAGYMKSMISSHAVAGSMIDVPCIILTRSPAFRVPERHIGEGWSTPDGPCITVESFRCVLKFIHVNYAGRGIRVSRSI